MTDGEMYFAAASMDSRQLLQCLWSWTATASRLPSLRQRRTMTLCTFIETALFSRLVHGYLDEDEYAALQAELARRPDAGNVVPGSGGVRKLRWAARSHGKSGGVRVIYFLRVRHGVIWLLTIYAKSEVSTVAPDVLRKIKDEIEHDLPPA